MYRLFENKLLEWKQSGMKKPLMVIGVRQIGKTYTIANFGKENTLFFFDEVQKSENFIVSLKYFNESEKPYKIICAGSLLRGED